MRIIPTLLLAFFMALPAWAARDFNGTTQNAELATALFTNEAFTVCTWFRLDTNAALQTLASSANNGADGLFRLFTVNTDSSIRAQKRSDAGAASSANTTSIATGTWSTACAVYASDTGRSVSLNGGTFVTDPTNVGDPTADFTSLAATKKSTYELYLDGQLGYAAWWMAALSQFEVTAFANGACPTRINTANLVSLVPLYGVNSPEPDAFGFRSWTLINSPAAAFGPPVRCAR